MWAREEAVWVETLDMGVSEARVLVLVLVVLGCGALPLAPPGRPGASLTVGADLEKMDWFMISRRLAPWGV